MSKEYLEALKRIRQETCPATYMADFDKNECCDVIEQALQRLEAIDNANPSEALEGLEEIIDNLDDYADFEIKQEANEYIDIIKQALLKAQEPKQYVDELKLVEKKLKALEIIKEKNVDIYQIKYMETLDDYNSVRGEEDRLTEEEFSLLKGILNEE